MIFEDDRSDEQKRTHPILIRGTDSFMSGWGGADGGASYAFWAVRLEDAYQVERWVRNRSDIQRVREVAGDYRPKSGACAHCHIYVVEPGHPALD